MAITEVFENPTVKDVIFQIIFPNLFFIGNKIGDFQMKIMKDFPDSSLIFRRQLVFVNTGSIGKSVELPETENNEQISKKIWSFRSPRNVELNVLCDSLDIHSTSHKTYNNPTSDYKFRDTIKFVIDNFIEITNIPLITRMGLRYTDECPVFKKDKKTFSESFNSAFNWDKFDISKVRTMRLSATVEKGECNLNYAESLTKINDEYKLIMDFDAFTSNIKSQDYLATADHLHDVISGEFENSIKAPIFTYMKTKPKSIEGDKK
ncbi:MAG: TIGR04255 family protein [Candidatus Margulisbacteria bacterium]|nr:TIGR04255 family protein [Candidatus Margulisiibacteriota bacterium]